MKVAVIVASDRASRGEREDGTGPALEEAARELGFDVAAVAVEPDDVDALAARIVEFADILKADVVLTAGGTGLGPRDVTPEATRRVVDREVPGIAEVMRAKSLAVTPNAMLSRAAAGTRGTCLIINLPGSPKAAVECLGFIAPALEHAVETLRGGTDCGRGQGP